MCLWRFKVINAKYKIEVWHGANLLHSITDAASNIYFKNVVTEGIGHFSFMLPTKKDNAYKYNDISLHDKVKIWLDYDSLPTDPLFVGRIAKIMPSQASNLRQISGFDQGEVLFRQLKRQKIWVNELASDIAIELAGDLGLGTSLIGIAEVPINIGLDSETYFDVLRKISDYYVDEDTYTRNDFYVDIADPPNLVWNYRPLRSEGVEVFTVGHNIKEYMVTKSITSVKNKLYVYGEQGKIGVPGALGRCEPTNMDLWTWDDNWTCTLGTIAPNTVNKKVGANSLQAYRYTSPYTIFFYRDVEPYAVGYGKSRYQTFNFWNYYTAILSQNYVQLYAPDSDNYFNYAAPANVPNAWKWISVQLGENQMHDEDKNPSGPWTVGDGSPSWSDITKLVFNTTCATDYTDTYIDGLYFGHGRWRATVEDAGVGSSQELYGIREEEYIYDALTSDIQCSIRGTSLLNILKDPPTQIDLPVAGNYNVRVSDQLHITIPSENIDDDLFYVTSVEQTLSDKPYTTISMTDNLNIRTKIYATVADVVTDIRKAVKRKLPIGEFDLSYLGP